jgi:hypothetical protein
MKRIAISSSGFRVSKPGFDVDTATVLNIQFDGYGTRYNGVYLSGIAYSSAGWPSYQIGNVYLGQVQHTRRYFDVSFSKTFSSPPQVLLAMRPAGDGSWGASPKYSHVQSASNGLVGSCVTAACNTTRLRITVDSPTYGTGSGATNWDVSYVVFQT